MHVLGCTRREIVILPRSKRTVDAHDHLELRRQVVNLCSQGFSTLAALKLVEMRPGPEALEFLEELRGRYLDGPAYQDIHELVSAMVE